MVLECIILLDYVVLQMDMQIWKHNHGDEYSIMTTYNTITYDFYVGEAHYCDLI